MVDSVDSGILAAAPPSLAPSPTAPAADLLPTRSAVDSDLSLRYSNAFPLTSPLEVSAVDFYLLGLGRRDDPFPPPGLAQWPSAPVEMEEDWPPFPDPGFDFPSPASGTGFEAHADPRLELLEVRQWSSVPIPDALAARAISFYLINEHPSLAFFDAGLFVRDLVSGGGEFCSPLLVSSLLAWACVRLQVALLPTLLLTARPGKLCAAGPRGLTLQRSLPRGGQAALGVGRAARRPYDRLRRRPLDTHLRQSGKGQRRTGLSRRRRRDGEPPWPFRRRIRHSNAPRGS